jgi:hypothetical protein
LEFCQITAQFQDIPKSIFDRKPQDEESEYSYYEDESEYETSDIEENEPINVTLDLKVCFQIENAPFFPNPRTCLQKTKALK